MSGSGKTLSGPSATTSAPPPQGSTQATRSPAANPEPSGALRTTPAKSTPSWKGGSGFIWYSPLERSRSGKLTPTALTSTTTSLSLGVGSGTSATSTPRGPTSELTWSERMGRP